MDEAEVNRQAKLKFIIDSLDGLIGLASNGRFEMLRYLLEMARLEAAEMEKLERDRRDA